MDLRYINKYGLLNASFNEVGCVAENCPLWSLEYLLLKWDGIYFLMKSSGSMYVDLLFYIHLSRTGKPGLYHQFPCKFHNTIEGKTKYMSNDQLIAYTLALHIDGKIELIKEIRTWLVSHFFTYDNVSEKTNFKRMMNPKAILTVLYCSGSKWVKPLLKFACKFSIWSARGETSGPLKAWTIAKTLGFVKDLHESEYDFKEAFIIYFPEETHPIRELLKNRLSI